MKTTIELIKNQKEAEKLFNKYQQTDTMLRNASNESVIEIINKKISRQKKSELSVKQFCDNLICKKLYSIAKEIPDEGYSMGSEVRIIFNKLVAVNNRTKDYPKSCRYKALHGSVRLVLSKEELINTKVIANLVTYIEPDQKNKVKKCYWYEGKGLKSNFNLTKVEGFIFANYHSKSKEDALKGGQANIIREKEQIKKAKNFNKALRLQYSFQDSLDCGNCKVGSEAFILRTGLDLNKKYRGSFLLSIAKEKSSSSVSFIERMINYKINKTS
jgi:hypothetical protein